MVANFVEERIFVARIHERREPLETRIRRRHHNTYVSRRIQYYWEIENRRRCRIILIIQEPQRAYILSNFYVDYTIIFLLSLNSTPQYVS